MAIDPTFGLPTIFLVLGVSLECIPYIQLTLGPIATLLGRLCLVQTFRIRFCFHETAFELRMGDNWRILVKMALLLVKIDGPTIPQQRKGEKIYSSRITCAEYLEKMLSTVGHHITLFQQLPTSCQCA